MKLLNNFDIEQNLASEYLILKNYPEAERHFQESIRLLPFEGNTFNLGVTYELMGDKQRAKEYYFKALTEKNYNQTIHKHDINTYITLARLLYLNDNSEVAAQFTKTALKDYPDSLELWVFLALSEYKLNKRDEALSAAFKARSFSNTQQTNYLYNQILNNLPIDLGL